MSDSSRSVFLPVEAAYDRWSAIYDTYDNPMVFTAAQALERGLAKQVHGKDVFEFGCGTGRNLQQLNDAGARFVRGCDLSAGMLAVARERNPGAQLFQHDMNLTLPAGVEDADVILFCLTLEHMADLTPPLHEAARILRNGGSITIIEIHPFMSLSGAAANFEHDGEEVRMPAFPHQFADYVTAFERSRLRISECREWSPQSLGMPEPLSRMKRGPGFPVAIEFRLVAL